MVICGGQTPGVRTSAWLAPAAFASAQSFFVSFVDCPPVPAITSTFSNPFSFNVSRAERIVSERSSCERCWASPLLPCTRMPVTPPCNGVNNIWDTFVGQSTSKGVEAVYTYLGETEDVGFDGRKVELLILIKEDNSRNIDTRGRRSTVGSRTHVATSNA